MRLDPRGVDFRQRGCRAVFRWLVSSYVVLVSGTICPAVEPDDAALKQALSTVLSVQPGEIAPVAEAWKVVAGARYGQLPLILNAMDEANGLAANWISMALDRIVERHGAEQLPVDVLNQSVLDTEHTLLTRKMSLDLLSRVDTKLVDDIQPRLMNDPEAELRRPAIDEAISAVREQPVTDAAQQQLIEQWLGILSAARDQDQVMQIARELKDLDYEVDLGAQFGYLVDWYIVGPFDNSHGQGYDTSCPPEELTLADYAKIAAGTAESIPGRSGSVKWKQVQAKASNGDVNLNEAIEKLRDVMAYGATVFQSDKSQQVDVRLRIQNSFKIWLNGKLLVEQPVGHTGNSFDQYTVRAKLQPGKNLFVVKSCQVDLQGSTQFYDNWHFCVRVCDATGAAILAIDRAVLPGSDSAEKGARRMNYQNLRLFSALLTVFVVVPCSAGDWPQFRGPNNNSVSSDKELPVEWTVADATWDIELPGRCVSGPIVTAGRVVTTSSSGRQNSRLHVFCVDADSGELTWTRQLWATGRTFCHPLTSMAAPTPATDGQRVYVLFASNDLACFDLDGNVLWVRAIGMEHPQTFDDRGLGSSPLLVGDTLVLQMECSGDSFAMGIACRDGSTRWRCTLPNSINWLSPAMLKVDDKELAMLQTGNQLLVLEPASGEVVSSYQAPGTAIASPVARDNVIFMPSRGLTALRFDPMADTPTLLWQENRLGAQRGSPVVDQGKLFVIRSTNILVCGDAKTGESLWSVRLKGSQFWATPIVAGDHVYTVSAEGLVQVVNIAGEKPEIIARNDMQEEMLGSPAISNGAIYLRGIQHLWKIAR